jgi:hypothetical protein
LKKTKLVLLLIVFVVAALLVSLPTAAHEENEAGEFALAFGWREEPAYAGLFNGPEIFISMHDAEEGAAFPADIVVTLQAEVTFGDASTTVFFEPAWGETGHYIADLIPTLPGDYTFHVTGTIGDTAVDIIWSSADGGFSSVAPQSDIMFPPIESADERIAALEARIAALEEQLAAP